MTKLKVYVVPTGFHDAYVAAPSQKAALEAWGSGHDLFARGIAQVVTDEALTAGPLASPGTVVKRSRGTTAEQIAALTEPEPRRAPPAKSGKAMSKAPIPPQKVLPRPSRDALDAAEQALAEGTTRHDDAEKAFAERQAALDRERRDAARAWDHDRDALGETIDAERARYDREMERWRG